MKPAAWRDAAPGRFSTSSPFYDNYRFRRIPRESFSFGRMFRFKERLMLQIRAEFTNPFNRTQVPNPQIGSNFGAGQTATSFASPLTRRAQTGNYTGGFGAIYTTPTNAAIGERSGLLVARFTF